MERSRILSRFPSHEREGRACSWTGTSSCIETPIAKLSAASSLRSRPIDHHFAGKAALTSTAAVCPSLGLAGFGRSPGPAERRPAILRAGPNKTGPGPAKGHGAATQKKSRAWPTARSGQWTVGSGQWAVGSGQWAVDGGQWTVDSGRGQWAVDGGRWTMDSGMV